jgi:hypothetical protein
MGNNMRKNEVVVKSSVGKVQRDDANVIPFSHTIDDFTSRAFFFLRFKMKPKNGERKEIELQMIIWITASIFYTLELARRAFVAVYESVSVPATR